MTRNITLLLQKILTENKMNLKTIHVLLLICSTSLGNYVAVSPYRPLYEKPDAQKISTHQENFGKPEPFHAPQYIRPPLALSLQKPLIPMSVMMHNGVVGSKDGSNSVVPPLGVWQKDKPIASLVKDLVENDYAVFADKIHIEAIPFKVESVENPIQVQENIIAGKRPVNTLSNSINTENADKTEITDVNNKRPVALETLLSEYSALAKGDGGNTNSLTHLTSSTDSPNEIKPNEVPFESLYQSYLTLLEKQEELNTSLIKENATINKSTQAIVNVTTPKMASVTTSPTTTATTDNTTTQSLIRPTTDTTGEQAAENVDGDSGTNGPSPLLPGMFPPVPDSDKYEPFGDPDISRITALNSGSQEHILPGFN